MSKRVNGKRINGQTEQVNGGMLRVQKRTNELTVFWYIFLPVFVNVFFTSSVTIARMLCVLATCVADTCVPCVYNVLHMCVPCMNVRTSA